MKSIFNVNVIVSNKSEVKFSAWLRYAITKVVKTGFWTILYFYVQYLRYSDSHFAHTKITQVN